MKMNLKFVLALSLAAISCAKQRPIETLSDPDTAKLVKSTLLGTPATGVTHWLGKVTVVKASSNEGFTFVGEQSEAKVGHFEFTKDKLRFLNDVSPYSKQSPSDTGVLINEWDVTHYDQKLSVSDGNVTNKESEDTDRPWNDKRFFKIDFSKANISEGATFPYLVDMAQLFSCWDKKASYVVDNSLEMSNDYLGFVVAVDYQQNSLCNENIRRLLHGDLTYTVQYKYSFKKEVPTSYTPFVYKSETDPLMQKFGFFQTVIESLNRYGVYRTQILMNRWDPENEHHYYFDKDFPEEWKGMYADPTTGIFAKTNKIFEEKGLKTRFFIHDNQWGDGKTKEFGDIRYSFIKIIPELDNSGLLGYGPSDADPLTGEIQAGNVILWTGIVNNYIPRMKETYARMETKFEHSSLFSIMASTLKQNDHTSWSKPIDASTKSGKAYYDILSDVTFAYPGYGKFTAQSDSETKTNTLESKFTHHTPEQLAEEITDLSAKETIKEGFKVAANYMDTIAHKSDMRKSNAEVYPLAEALNGAEIKLINGTDPLRLIRTLMYRTAIHEFGHNLGLRHNFYGSVDKRNFGPAIAAVDENGKPQKDSKGVVKMWQPKTSSVMDYMDLEDDVTADDRWEPYDIAALSNAYSSGKIMPDHGFLFCTDEHSITNALCNTWDHGTTPSEIAMGLIESYENNYQFQNYRFNRAYWNTRHYASYIYSDMRALKKFLLLWRSGLYKGKITEFLDNNRALTVEDKNEIGKDIQSDLKQAVRLSIAFYNAVIQQSAASRPFDDEFAPFSGDKTRVGILYDKLFAMYFLMGDDSMVYNPNRPMYYASYLTHQDEPELSELIDTINENALTERVDMQPWFISYARELYAYTATNPYNRDDVSKINKIKSVRYHPEQLRSKLGIEPSADLDSVTRVLEKGDDTYFRVGEEVGITRINDLYYVASKERNPYAYAAGRKAIEARNNGESVGTPKEDLLELYRLYTRAIGDTAREN